MNIDDMTIGELKEIRNFLQIPTQHEQRHPFVIGRNYLIRTVTMALTGRLVAIYSQELVIENAAWIAHTGRFADSFTDGFDEIEPFPDGQIIVGRGAVIDMSEYELPLPRVQQ